MTGAPCGKPERGAVARPMCCYGRLRPLRTKCGEPFYRITDRAKGRTARTDFHVRPFDAKGSFIPSPLTQVVL